MAGLMNFARLRLAARSAAGDRPLRLPDADRHFPARGVLRSHGVSAATARLGDPR